MKIRLWKDSFNAVILNHRFYSNFMIQYSRKYSHIIHKYRIDSDVLNATKYARII